MKKIIFTIILFLTSQKNYASPLLALPPVPSVCKGHLMLLPSSLNGRTIQIFPFLTGLVSEGRNFLMPADQLNQKNFWKQKALDPRLENLIISGYHPVSNDVSKEILFFIEKQKRTLKQLSLPLSLIPDIMPLTQKGEVIESSSALVKDMPFVLGSLRELKKLRIVKSHFSDDKNVFDLSFLNALEELEIDITHFKDLRWLQKMTALNKLSLRSNGSCVRESLKSILLPDQNKAIDFFFHIYGEKPFHLRDLKEWDFDKCVELSLGFKQIPYDFFYLTELPLKNMVISGYQEDNAAGALDHEKSLQDFLCFKELKFLETFACLSKNPFAGNHLSSMELIKPAFVKEILKAPCLKNLIIRCDLEDPAYTLEEKQKLRSILKNPLAPSNLSGLF